MSSVSPTSTSTTTPATTPTATQTQATGSNSSGSTSTSAATAGQTILTALGSGAGFNVDDVVSAIVTSEGAGLTDQYNAQITAIDTQVSAYSQFSTAAATVQTAIDTLTTPATFNSFQAVVGDTSVASASATTGAVSGNYSLAVTQVAQGAALTSAVVSGGATGVLGTGTLSIAVGGTQFNVTLGSTNDTLAGLANAINNATGNPGVGATLITTNTGTYLQLSSSVTGAANTLSVTATGASGTLATFNYTAGGAHNGLTQSQAAQDAIVSINGQAFNSASNTITGAITGVTINALAASKSGVTTTLTVAPDPTGPTSAVNSFVSAYNSLVNEVSSLTSYNAATSTAGPLLGDTLIGGFVAQMQGIIAGGQAGASGTGSAAINSLAQIGITVNDDGTLAVNSTALQSALQTNSAAVSNLFTNKTGGVATKLNGLLTTYTATGGLIDQATQSLQTTLTGIGTQQTVLNDQLTQLQSQLYAEYTAMETVVAGLKSTATALTSELASLPQNWGPVSTTTTG